MGDLAALRRELRTCRRQIQGQERDAKSAAAAAHALQWFTALPQATHIGVFLSMAEEIDSRPLIRALWRQGKSLYLPVVAGKNSPLCWRAYRPDTPLIADVFGIAVPKQEQDEEASILDAALMPLVGADRRGNRIGMGGGFYDRTFADKIRAHSPRLIGLAYDCQLLSALPRQVWDVPMDALATETQLLHFI